MDRDPAEIPIQYSKGVGPQRAKLLSRISIKTVRDALSYVPSRYEDRQHIKKMHHLTYGERETVLGKVVSREVIHLPRSAHRIFELTVSDGTGLVKGKWFNQPYLKRLFAVGQKVILSGVVKPNAYRGTGYEMDRPEYEFVLDEDQDSFIHTARIVPIYRTTAGLSVRILRSIIFHVLQTYRGHLSDPVSATILREMNLPDLPTTIAAVHFPPPGADIALLNRGTSAYHQRLAFDELFHLEIGIAAMKQGAVKRKGIAFTPDGRLVAGLRERLPFSLTAAQQRVFHEIYQDMKQPYPMNRLLQGDVGCGKTMVALMAMLSAVECGYQTALMAPTEILAEQHYLNIHRLVEDLGLSIALLTASTKERPLTDIASGKIALVAGTHALIQEGVRFKKLGLVVIDEQHRFGVMQRAALRKKARNPDVLVMTATPIPRTLAMTAYGDLDYSVIDELPAGRTPVTTVLFTSGQKQQIYEAIAAEVNKGRQIYVVYPVIEESENSDLKSAIMGKQALERIFPDFRIGLIHGKMKTIERETVMRSFKDGAIDILVSTTVIEVGVDVPNATLMVIVHAERFGLSQLHQLRGRVGRGGSRSSCLLLAYEPYGEEAGRRLNIMVQSTDGFRIAEEDLAIRGPGEFFGTRQSGIPDLKIANIVRDVRLLDAARGHAFALLAGDPDLAAHPELKRSVARFWEGKVDIFKTS